MDNLIPKTPNYSKKAETFITEFNDADLKQKLEFLEEMIIGSISIDDRDKTNVIMEIIDNDKFVAGMSLLQEMIKNDGYIK